jgi:fructokinase
LYESEQSSLFCSIFRTKNRRVFETEEALARRARGVSVKIISIGEVLWDVVGNAEHLGGAPFNFAAHLTVLGHSVSFISAVGEDERGRKVLERVAGMGLSSRYVHCLKQYGTGVVTVTLDGQGQPQFVIHRPAAYDFPGLSDAEWKELLSGAPEWIYFGTLLQMSPQARRLTARILDANPHARRFYDVNLRVNCYEASLVWDLMSRASIVKLNEHEAAEIARLAREEPGPLEQFCRSYSQRFGWEAVCVTRGADGCVLLIGDEYIAREGYPVEVVDTVGAGDAFAAAFIHGFAAGWRASEIADFANRVGAIVASRPGAIPEWSLQDVRCLERQIQIREQK